MAAGGAWLLLLGSNLASDDRVREAMARLRAVAPLDALTAIQRFPDYTGQADAAAYFNTLAAWHLAAPRDAVQKRLKALERTLGRERGAAEVAIDIDVLAKRDDDGAWIADTHALVKSAFTPAPVRTLLTEAGIALDLPDAPGPR